MSKPSNTDNIEHSNVLSPEDQLILEGFKPVVDAIGQIFGSSCEVVLHSLQDLSHSVICIHNGAKTGRGIGSPVTDKALSILKSFEHKKNGNSGLYQTRSSDGHIMRSSTTLIKGLKGQPIGLLCINFDTSTPLNELAQILMQPHLNDADNEHFAIDIDDLFLNQVMKVKQEVMADDKISQRQKTKEIIWRLNEAGVFKLRRSVTRVAEILKISRDVIYMHLRAV